MTMSPNAASKVQRPTIEPGKHYVFYCDAQQDYEPPEKRLRRFTGQAVLILGQHPTSDPDASTMYRVQASDGTRFEAWEEELNGWDRDLGQYFWPDGTYGPDHDERFLVNERP